MAAKKTTKKKTARKRAPRGSVYKLSLDQRSRTLIELWSESLEIEPAEVVSRLMWVGDRSLRISERERVYSPAQRRKLQPMWDEIDKRLGLTNG